MENVAYFVNIPATEMALTILIIRLRSSFRFKINKAKLK